MTRPEWIALAAFGAPHGVKGQIKLRSFTDPADAFMDYPDLQLADGTPVRLRLQGQAQGQFIVAIDGVQDRTEAQRWSNREIGTPTAALPALTSEAEFYHRELIGMQVIDTSGVSHGTVLQVANYGAGDLLEIGTKASSEFYSFTHANFPKIDREKRVITFEKPEILAVGEEKS